MDIFSGGKDYTFSSISFSLVSVDLSLLHMHILFIVSFVLAGFFLLGDACNIRIIDKVVVISIILAFCRIYMDLPHYINSLQALTNGSILSDPSALYSSILYQYKL